MHTSEVTELRKAGQLEEAYAKAIENLAEKPKDFYRQSDLAWTLLTIAKQAIEKGDFAKSIACLHEYQDIKLPKPALLHSMMLKLALELKDHPDFDFMAFMEKWDVIHLRRNTKNPKDDDFLPFVLERNGKTRSFPSLAENTYLAIAGKILASYDKEKIESFYPQLEQWITDNPTFQSLLYYRIRFKIILGIKQGLEEELIAYVQRKPRDRNAWEMLARFYKNDDRALAAYVKAITLSTDHRHAAKIRVPLAKVLAEKAMYPEAKTELELIRRAQEQYGIKLSPEHTALIQESWYAETNAYPDNRNLYRKWQPIADELLEPNTHSGIITYIDQENGFIYYLVNQQLSGRFPINKLRAKPYVGMPIDMVIQEKKDETKGTRSVYYVTRATQSPNPPSESIAKGFFGRIKLYPDKNFGFVGEIYIQPNLLSKGYFQPDTDVSGIAVLQYDKKKDKWGWMALTLEEGPNGQYFN